MSLLRNHIVLMLLYALATAAFFTLLWKQERRDRIRFFFFVLLSLFFGGIALGWAMYPFPIRWSSRSWQGRHRETFMPPASCAS